MSNLGKSLYETIQHLEQLRDSGTESTDEIVKTLDVLYEQQIALSEAAINENTEKYKQATAAMNEAAKQTQEALKDLTKIEKVLKKVAKVIDKIADVV